MLKTTFTMVHSFHLCLRQPIAECTMLNEIWAKRRDPKTCNWNRYIAASVSQSCNDHSLSKCTLHCDP